MVISGQTKGIKFCQFEIGAFHDLNEIEKKINLKIYIT